jgi:hypothetical protein
MALTQFYPRWQDFTEASCHEVFPITVYCDMDTNHTVRAHIVKKIFYSLVRNFSYFLSFSGKTP